MKIIGIKTTVIQGRRGMNYVRVDTDSGISGFGEAHPGDGICDLVHKRVQPLVIGEDPRNVEPLYNKMLDNTVGQSQAGSLLAAIAGVETALWDVAGKASGLPVCRLLGGQYRDRIRLYADVGRGTHGENTPETWAERARQGVADGFEAIKFDIDHSADELQHDPHDRGLSLSELDKMEALVAAVRDAVGNEIDLCMDCHGKYNVRDAINLAQRLERFNLMFLEDPVPPENIESMAKVTAATNMPICTGEWLHRRDGFRSLITEQAADMLHVDVSSTGGMLEAKRIADFADMYYIPFAAHNITSPLGLCASAHVCAAVRNLNAMELPYHWDEPEWRWDLLRSAAPLIQDAHFAVPDAPGLGVELNHDVCRLHLRAGESYFE